MFDEMKLKSVSQVMLTLSVVALLTGCKKADQSSSMQGQNVAAVETYTVTTGDLSLDNEYPATIKGKMDIDVRPMISGTITKVCVDEGQRVSKGQLLFLIDDVQYQAAVRSAEAGVASARAAVTSAEAQVATSQSSVATAQLTATNQKKLLDKGIISSYQYQTAALSLKSAQSQLNAVRQQVGQARAGLAQAEQQLVDARKNLSYSRVVAPCDGVVGQIPNREGSLASPSGAALTTISDNTSIYAYFSFNEKQVLALTKNGSISLQAAIQQLPQVKLKLANGEIYGQLGRVSTVSGVLDQTTGSAQVRALFSNVNGMLRSGSTGSILIPATTGRSLVIPQKATYEIQDQKYVYVVGADHKATARAITVMDENDGQNYAVTGGLSVGDVIVIEGVGTQVKEGTTIITKEQAAAAMKAQAAKAKK